MLSIHMGQGFLRLCNTCTDIININNVQKWGRNQFLERFYVKYLVAYVPLVFLDAALTLEMTSSCEKSANILGEIRGFDHILLSCLHFLRKALQKKERQTFKCFKGRCNKCPSDAISRYSQWKNSDMVLVEWMCIYY